MLAERLLFLPGICRERDRPREGMRILLGLHQCPRSQAKHLQTPCSLTLRREGEPAGVQEPEGLEHESVGILPIVFYKYV